MKKTFILLAIPVFVLATLLFASGRVPELVEIRLKKTRRFPILEPDDKRFSLRLLERRSADEESIHEDGGVVHSGFGGIA